MIYCCLSWNSFVKDFFLICCFEFIIFHLYDDIYVFVLMDHLFVVYNVFHIWFDQTSQRKFSLLIKHHFWFKWLIYDFIWLICFHSKTLFAWFSCFSLFWFHKSIFYTWFLGLYFETPIYRDISLCVLIILFVCEWYLAYLPSMLAHICLPWSSFHTFMRHFDRGSNPYIFLCFILTYAYW